MYKIKIKVAGLNPVTGVFICKDLQHIRLSFEAKRLI